MTVGEFFAWWRSELTGILPDGWRRRFERRHNTLLLSANDDEVRIGRRDNGRLEELGRISMTRPDARERMAATLGGLQSAATRIEIAVPSEKVLLKQIHLPLAAEENLREVLGFEMQRQTPFRAEQVYFNYRVVARRPKNQQLDVKLSVVPRAVVEGVFDSLVDWKLVQAKGGDKVDRDDRVFAFEPAGSGPRTSSALQRGLLIANLLLLIAVIAIPFVQQNHYLEQLRARLSEVRAAATTASNLQQSIDQYLQRSRYLFAQKAGQPASVELLEELSRRIPDETWLFRAEIRDGKVHLQGTSTRASALIAELEDSRFLEDVHFASPVTQDGASGRERFHLSASIVAQATPERSLGREGRDS